MILKNLKLKVCGMRDAENINQLSGLQPDYIGFIFYSKSKRYAQFLDSSTINNIPASIKKTGVFVNADYNEVSEKIEQYKLDAIQLHGEESADFCLKFHKSVEVIKAFGLGNEFNFNELTSYNDVADFFLFDTKTNQHGGSGRTFDWAVLQNYTLQKPYFLSGGLSADNLSEIKGINDSRLYGLDFNSRFEIEPGFKDIEKLRSVFNEIKVPV